MENKRKSSLQNSLFSNHNFSYKIQHYQCSLIHWSTHNTNILSCRIFEYFATKTRIYYHIEMICYKPHPVTEFIKLSPPSQARHHFGAKTTRSTLPSKRLHPFYIKIEYSLKLDPVTLIRIDALFVSYKQVG